MTSERSPMERFMAVADRLERNGYVIDHGGKTVILPGRPPGLKLLGSLDVAKAAGYILRKGSSGRKRR